MKRLRIMQLPLLAGAAALILAAPLFAANVRVDKTVSVATPAEGQTIVYTIVVRTTDSQASGGFTVYDVLPPGMTFVSAIATISAYDTSTKSWPLSALAGNDSDTLRITASVNGGTEGQTITNTAYKSNTGSGDTNPDDTSRVSIQVATQPPTITAALQSSGTRYQSMNVKLAGSHFIQGVTQVDFGAGIAVTSRTVTSPDTLVAGIYISSAAASGPHTIRVVNPPPGGGADSLPGGFSVVNPLPVLTTLVPAIVYAGDTPTITVNGSNFVPGSGVLVNGVNRAATFIDSTKMQALIPAGDVATSGYVLIKAFNPTPGGGASVKTDSLLVRPSADLAVQKVLGPLRQDTLTYILTVKNLGPSDATNASLTDNLPNTLTYISSVASGSGQYSPGSDTWTVGDVAAGDSATCTIVTRVTNPNQPPVTITNIAGGVTAVEFDRVSSNNADTASILLKIVRPGDTNNDLIVDARDIVRIGLCYGITGPVRTGTSDTLQQYLPSGWNTVGSPEVCAYGDCDGNGSVDSGDVWMIISNWGRTNWTGEIEPSAAPSAFSRAEIIRQLLASAEMLPPGQPRDEILAMLSSRQREIAGLPAEWRLEQNYPNPFNGGTTITYAVPGHADAVRLSIYDVLGRNIRTFERFDVGQGSYVVRWDGNTEDGMQVASGVYFYSLEASGFTAVRRLLYIR